MSIYHTTNELRGHFEGKHVIMPIPLLKKLSERMDTAFHCRSVSDRQKCTRYCRILQTHREIFLRWCKPNPVSARSAWTQTPSSAWLASVPIVPVLWNDRCSVLPPTAVYISGGCLQLSLTFQSNYQLALELNPKPNETFSFSKTESRTF